jgi:hypothetical protein
MVEREALVFHTNLGTFLVDLNTKWRGELFPVVIHSWNVVVVVMGMVTIFQLCYQRLQAPHLLGQFCTPFCARFL